MQIAVPIWEGRVSPVFDTARNLLVVQAVNGRETGRIQRAMLPGQGPSKVHALSTEGIDVLICGAISRRFLDMCSINRIRVIPWVSGPVNDVISAFLAGTLPHPAYTMPGCRKRKRRGRRRRGRGGLNMNPKPWK